MTVWAGVLIGLLTACFVSGHLIGYSSFAFMMLFFTLLLLRLSEVVLWPFSYVSPGLFLGRRFSLT